MQMNTKINSDLLIRTQHGTCANVHKKIKTDPLITVTFMAMTCKMPIECRLLFMLTVNLNVFTVPHSDQFPCMDMYRNIT
jgi:hypothetical protein